MQDGESNKGKDEAKRGTIGQAHLMHDTRKHVFTVAATSSHSRIQSRTKARTKRRATTEYNCYMGTLTQFYFTRLVPHTHTFTQNPKETKVATSLARTESFSRAFSSQLLRRGR